MRIGLFDSGVGGLTVLKRLIIDYPNNEYIYFGDTKNNPYGSKNKDELEKLSSSIIDFLISKDVDLIVIACGTVSSNLSEVLRNKYDIKIIDIISPVIKYINNSEYNKIGVIATEATVKSNAFRNITKDVRLVACKEFVPIIEKNDYSKLDKYLDLYLNELKDRELVVLGCTHYPIIKEQIQKYFGDNIKLLDMGECLPDISNINNYTNVRLYFSELNDSIIKNIKKILDKDYCIEKSDI